MTWQNEKSIGIKDYSKKMIFSVNLVIVFVMTWGTIIGMSTGSMHPFAFGTSCTSSIFLFAATSS